MTDQTNSDVARYIRNDTIQKRIENLLNERALQFTTSLVTAVNNNTTLAKCEPSTVLNAALTAASLDLPISASLGFAAIVPFYDSRSKTFKAQFQIMTNGYIQLAQRSNQYKTIAVTKVYAGQLLEENPLTGFRWDWSQPEEGEPIGYAAYFQLLNGFEKTLYWSKEKVNDHAVKYSSSYQNDLKDKTRKSLWSYDFESMGLKTVLKRIISKYGPMSTSLEQALRYDQAVITDKGESYIDNQPLEGEKASDEDKKAIIDANKGDGDDN